MLHRSILIIAFITLSLGVLLPVFLSEDASADANIEFELDVAYLGHTYDLVVHNVTGACWLFDPDDYCIDTKWANATGDVTFTNVYLWSEGTWYAEDIDFNMALLEVYKPGEGDWYSYTNSTVDTGRVWIDDIIKGGKNNAQNYLTYDLDDNATTRYNLTDMSIPADDATHVILEYDLYVPNATVDAYMWFPIYGNDTNNFLFTVSPYISQVFGSWYCLLTSNNGSGYVGLQNETGVTLNMDFSTWYKITIMMNLSNETYKVQIINKDTLSSMTSEYETFSIEATNITGFGFGDKDSYTLNPVGNKVLFSIDNLVFYDNISTFREDFALDFAPSIISPSPANDSTNIDYQLDEVSAYIYDPEGDWFNWTIEVNTSDSSYGNYAHNGTKKCLLENQLSLNTTYTFWINITAYSGTNNPVNRTIEFTLEPFNGPPNITNPNPGNNTKNISSILSIWTCYISDPEGDTFNYTIDIDGTIQKMEQNTNNGTKNVTFASKHSYRHEYTVTVNITGYTATEEPINETYSFKIARDPGAPWSTITEGFKDIVWIVYIFIFLGVSLFLMAVFGRR